MDPETRRKAALTDSLPDPPSPEQLAEMARDADESARIKAANLMVLHSAGVPVVVGSDAGNPLTLHGPAIHLEMEAMVEAGMTPMEVLVSATRNGARAMGREQDFGTLEPGRIANLVVLDADPLASVSNTRRIALVARGGHVHTRTELAYPTSN